jgi:CRP-like cAMP-binding protein
MNRDEGLRILGESGWLSETPAEFRDSLLPLGRWHRIEEGAHITLSGEENEDLIGLASGYVAFTATQGLPETPIMHMASAPFWMGYGPLLHGTKRVVNAQARTTVWIASFPKSKVIPLLESRPGWWRPFMKLMATYGDLTALIAADLLIKKSETRCAAVLLRFAGARLGTIAPGGPIRVPVSQEELAEASNLSRGSVVSILRHFAASGLVDTSYRGIEIRDASGLQELLQKM